jgi:hypothetical protein
MPGGQCVRDADRWLSGAAERDYHGRRASSESIDMANREQKSNREKKKPKQDKNTKVKSPSPFVQPELSRKPHKTKGEG